MLDRAPQPVKPDSAAETRPVEFRGAGFVPGVSRFGGWTALAVVIVEHQVRVERFRIRADHVDDVSLSGGQLHLVHQRLGFSIELSLQLQPVADV